MNEFENHRLSDLKTDPRLDALLDDALSPDPAPEGMDQRIVVATADRLPGRAGTAPADPVIGRIGGGLFRGPWRAAAAVLLLGTVIGGLWLANRDGDSVDPEQPPIAKKQPVQVADGLEQLAAAELQTGLQAEVIDDQIALLSMQVSWAETDGVWAEDALESLDMAIARDEFDELSEQLDLYF